MALSSEKRDHSHRLRKTKWSFSNVAGLIRQYLGTYLDLIKFLINPEKALIGYQEKIPEYQLTLFKTGSRGLKQIIRSKTGSIWT